MSWYRPVLLAVAVAGIATGTVLVYRYTTHGLGGNRPQDEEEIPEVRSRGLPQTRSVSQTQSSINNESVQNTETTEPIELNGVQEIQLSTEQDFEMDRLVVQEGNMLLSMFGMAFMAIVVIVAFIVTLTNENIQSVMQVEMFPPLMFIGLGILAASMIHSVNERTLVSPLPPVITDKGGFPESNMNIESRSSREPIRKGVPAPFRRSPSPRRQVTFEEIQAPPIESNEPKPELADLIAKADELYDNVQFKEAKAFLEANLSHYPTSVELLWRSARACQDMTNEVSSVEAKKALVFEGMEYAERAYAAGSNDAMSNKWMGIMISSCGNYRDTSEKIKGAYKIKNFITRAIELNPTDATAHNILGQWCLAFANLGWLEKQAATMLFGKPPTATYDEAVRHFHDAENISPGFWKKNTFLLGETYSKMKNYEEAKLWLVKAKQIPIKTTEDKEVQKEIDALLAKL